MLITPSLSERLQHDPGYRSHIAKFSSTPLHAIAFGVNRATTLWESGDTTPATIGPNGSALVNLPAQSVAYRWAASECVRHALLWSPVFSFESPAVLPETEISQVMQLVHHASSAQLDFLPNDEALLTSSGPWDFIYPTWSPQYLMARSSALRIGQALWMFRDALQERMRRDSSFPARRLQESFESALGMAVDDFVGMLVLAYGRSWSPTPVVRPELYAASNSAERFRIVARGNDGSGLFQAKFAAFTNVVAADARASKTWMSTQVGDESHGALLSAPNSLLRFPLLRPFREAPDCAIAPLPSQLLEWLYEPMVHYLFASLSSDLPYAFSSAFEEYVGMVLNRHRPSGPEWLHEREVQPAGGGKVVDWVRAFSRTVVLVDAKRCFLKPRARYRLEAADWASLETGLQRGVGQAAEFWESAKAGKVAALKEHTAKVPLLLLVSQSDTSVIGLQRQIQEDLSRLAESSCPGLRVAIVSVDQLHQLATNWRVNDDAWFEKMCLRVVNEGREIIRDAAPYRADGPLFDAASELFLD